MRDWVVPMTAERVTPGETTESQDAAADEAVPRDRLGCVVRTPGHEPATPGKPGREDELIPANEGETDSGRTGQDGSGQARLVGRGVPGIRPRG